MKRGPNESIGCTVTECKYHAHDEAYCTLDKIQVAKHVPEATNIESTDCASFQNQAR
ncbi:MAG: DUF1540 domain-containing protein [Bacillota bacterium]|nr:DUF1540 domain-containing protein [Bacillota bacterium]